MGLLWEHWLSTGQREFICESINEDEEKAKSFLMFLASVHDIGKATPVFQSSKGYNYSADLDQILLDKLEKSGFKEISNLVLPSPRFTKHALAGQTLLSWYGLRDDITSIIGAHHGKPIDDDYQCEVQKSYLTNYFQTENRDDPVYQKWDRAQKDIFSWALEANGFSSIDELPKVSQPCQVILSGLVIMADWIASNTDYFPLIQIDSYTIEDQQERLEKGWTSWEQSDLWQASSSSEYLDLYEKRFGFKPRNVQEIFSKIIDQTNDPGIFILEAPMGCGKTEAALVGAEQLASKTGKSGIFFGLPTQATSNGIFPRIQSWLNRLGQESDEKYGLRLVHGKAALNPYYERLANNVNIDNGQEETVIINEWFSGRKTSSLDDFVVGTVDHFLLLALKQKHLALRHLGFTKKVVIIDEVHAYDSYMNQYLLEAIGWMGTYNVPVIILSATLPADRREELIKSYLSGKGLKWRREVAKPAEGLKTDAYPLITYNNGNEVKQEKEFEKAKEKTVNIEKTSDEDLEEIIDDLYQAGGVIGIIVNTIKRAQEIAEACTSKYSDDRVSLLHSNFIATDRIKKEDDLLSIIGKKADRPERHIVVGTQVIEQSLDIDFDVMISDLAPMDLLIQRLGRLHRHDIERPKDHKEAKLYVVGTSENFDFDDGTSFVYGDYLLIRTQHFLGEKMSLPNDISKLVQKVYGQEEIDLEDDLDKKYIEAKEKYNVLIKNKELKAKTFKIEEPVLKESRLYSNSLVGWLKNSNPNTSQEYAYAQVRDIQETIEVIAVKKLGKGYTLFGEDVDISDRISEFDTARNLAKHTLALPNALSQAYNIEKTIEELEKYNSKKLNNWQKEQWLRGSLGIVFDEDNNFSLNGYRLHYDNKYGLSYERVEKCQDSI